MDVENLKQEYDEAKRMAGIHNEVAKGINEILDCLNKDTVKFVKSYSQRISRESLQVMLESNSTKTISLMDGSKDITVDFETLNKICSNGIQSYVPPEILAECNGTSLEQYLESRKNITNHTVGTLLEIGLYLNFIATDYLPFTPIKNGDGVQRGYGINKSEKGWLMFEDEEFGLQNFTDGSFNFVLSDYDNRNPNKYVNLSSIKPRSVLGQNVRMSDTTPVDLEYTTLTINRVISQFPEIGGLVLRFLSVDYEGSDLSVIEKVLGLTVCPSSGYYLYMIPCETVMEMSLQVVVTNSYSSSAMKQLKSVGQVKNKNPMVYFYDTTNKSTYNLVSVQEAKEYIEDYLGYETGTVSDMIEMSLKLFNAKLAIESVCSNEIGNVNNYLVPPIGEANETEVYKFGVKYLVDADGKYDSTNMLKRTNVMIVNPYIV